MDPFETKQALELLASRLVTLSGILDKAEREQEGQGLDELAATRLAPDMHPLAWQVSAAAAQAHLFLEWSRGNDLPNVIPEPGDWAQARRILADTLERIIAASAEPAASAPEIRRIMLPPIGCYLDLPARRYLDDWIAPNLYFHLTTAYAILRMKGIALGKGDFMQHIVGDLRPIEVPA